MIAFNVTDRAALSVLHKILEVLTQIKEMPIMATTPVSQASFDDALTAFVAAYTALEATGQQIAAGLAAVEAALTAAQGSSGSDFTNELAIVQNLQAKVAADQASAAALVAGLPAGIPTNAAVKSE